MWFVLYFPWKALRLTEKTLVLHREISLDLQRKFPFALFYSHPQGSRSESRKEGRAFRPLHREQVRERGWAYCSGLARGGACEWVCYAYP